MILHTINDAKMQSLPLLSTDTLLLLGDACYLYEAYAKTHPNVLVLEPDAIARNIEAPSCSYNTWVNLTESATKTISW